MDRSVRGLDGAPEWPAMRALLPDLRDKRVLDLGCGFGWFARWAVEQGAASVLGVDLSENMLERAKAETPDQRVRYVKADLETLDLPQESFDLAYSSLALHYVQDFGRLIGEVSRALVSGGNFVFSIEHPIYMASMKPGWLATERRRPDLAGRSLCNRRRAGHRLAGERRAETAPDLGHDAEYADRRRLLHPARGGMEPDAGRGRGPAFPGRRTGAADDGARGGAEVSPVVDPVDVFPSGGLLSGCGRPI